MPGVRCAVFGCFNRSESTKDNINIKYHSFPKDPTRCQIWLHKTRRKDLVNPRTARICSEHFKADDYARDLKSELLNLPSKLQLKPDAIPSLRLDDTRAEPEKSSKEERMEKRTRTELVQFVNCGVHEIKSEPTIEDAFTQPMNRCSNCLFLQTKYQTLEEEHNRMTILCERQRVKIRELTKKLFSQERELKNLRKSIGTLQENEDSL